MYIYIYIYIVGASVVGTSQLRLRKRLSKSPIDGSTIDAKRTQVTSAC